MILVNHVVHVRLTDHLIVAKARKWALDMVEKGRRAFFLEASEEIHGGKCVVTQQSVCHPKYLGGLGVIDLRKQGIVLRLRWEWLKRTDDSKPWQGPNFTSDWQVALAFNSLVQWQIGDENRVLFWKD